MANVVSVADYALSKFECLSTMKLQKIVFYSQAYHLVTFHAPLFEDRIEAWVNGPVAPRLFRLHRGKFIIPSDFFKAEACDTLTADEQHSIDHVVGVIGDESGASLSDLTHSEDPWRVARGDSTPDAVIHEEITRGSIASYYGSPSCMNPIFAHR